MIRAKDHHDEDAERRSGDSRVRMDMHVHSWASNGPAIAALGLIDAPECCSAPEAVYEQAMNRGMDLATLTDHDTIAGGLELVDRGFERVILGEEVTVKFPEDGRTIHCLVWGLSPAEHEQLGALRLRDDIYSFAGWLRDRELAHAVAHPLDGIGDTRAIWRLERLALLFRGFEVINGAHAGGHAATVRAWIDTLTPDRLRSIGKRHLMAPVWPPDAPRATTGGSDDHGLLNIGTAWTGVDREAFGDDAVTLESFLDRVMSGDGEPSGRSGRPSLLAHQFVSVGMARFAEPITSGLRPTRRLVSRKIAAFAGVDLPRPSRRSILIDSLRGRRKRKTSESSVLLESLLSHFHETLASYPDLAARLAPEGRRDGPAIAAHDRMAALAEELFVKLSRDVADAAVTAYHERDWRGLQSLARDAGALGLAQAPYFISLFLHNKDRWGVERVEHELAGNNAPTRPMRLALFTDTLGDVNGVSRFIRQFAEWAERTGRELHVFAFEHERLPELANVHPVKPIFSAATPGYEELKLHLPPLLSVMREVNDLQPDAVHVSTPGPMGLAGAMAAEMMRAPLLGTHHTDFPAYIQRLMGDQSMVKGCERLLRTLYSRFDRVVTRSKSYIPSVRRLRVEDRRIVPLEAGVDSQTFHPQKRDLRAWRGLARVDSVKALYAGRVSVEKNTTLLEQTWKIIRRRCEERGIDAELIVVGDGPDRSRLERSLESFGARFLGYRHGEELATLYASSDLFIFPSITDTLGQVVLEAQASGLPAIVSSAGGPREIVADGKTGFVLQATEPRRWVEAALSLIDDETTRRAMGAAARRRVQGRTIDAMYGAFWAEHEEAVERRRTHAGLETPTPEPIVSDAMLGRLAADVAGRFGAAR